MNSPSASNQPSTVMKAVEIAISLGLIFVIIAWCLKILTPFLSVIIWGAVLAIAIYTPFLKLKSAVGDRKGLAVALFAVIGLAVVIVPAYMFAGSMVEGAANFGKNVAAGTFAVALPADSVKDWPVVGKKVHAAWSAAATDFTEFLVEHKTEVTAVSKSMVGKIASVGLGVLQFLISILIAAAFLSNAEKTANGCARFFNRLAGDQGAGMLDLSVATIRSVAVGVLGIAFIQAFLAGVGLVAAGVPYAGIWVLIILIFAIAQLPPLLVLLPIIFYVFSVESTTVAVIFAIWSVMVSFSDAFLKPLMLGRGVEAPMLVILLGAIGGMVAFGIIGLFLGAVILALGYKLFIRWLDEGEAELTDSEA